MLVDLAVFEPNNRGTRPFDRFLAGPALKLPVCEQDVARRMGCASFSICRLVEKHETIGTWAEDTLDNDPRLWLIDLDVDEPNRSHTAFAVRIFDAGSPHVTLGVITSISDRMVNVFRRAHDTDRRPHRRSLAAINYGLAQLNGLPPTHASGWKFVDDPGPELKPGDPS
jgi:hypothetical protein